MREIVMPFDEALTCVLHHAAEVPPGEAHETLPLHLAAGRVLAAPLCADRDQPPFRRSTRDGYAVRSADLSAARALRVTGCLRAGETWHGPALAADEVIEIMTGAPVPASADAVVMLEHVRALDATHIVLAEGRSLAPGDNIVPQGAEARAGEIVVVKGRVLSAAEIALAASCGYAELYVAVQPSVAIVATGDELVDVRETPQTWQIRNSNTHGIAALVRAAGGRAVTLAPARDTLEDVRARLLEAQSSEMIVLSGGVSKGKYDLVEQVLEELGAEFFFTGVLMQPGRPVVFGRLPKPSKSAQDDGAWTYFFGLPGNPISTQVTFQLFVAPLLRALCGESDVAPRFVEAALAEDVRGGAKVTRFLPAVMTSSWKAVSVKLTGWQGSGDMAANARANCYCVLPTGVAEFKAGETVRVLLR